MTSVTVPASRADYDRIFHVEQVREYPAIDAFEHRCGYRLDRVRLETAARVLACPFKAHPPSWQHGRVLYAIVRRVLKDCHAHVLALDVGTAKGFSALVLRWALDDAGVQGDVVSVDVIDPCERRFRKTVRDTEGPTTLFELLADWPEASRITFKQSTGAKWLRSYSGRIHVAFVDGKHSYPAVREESDLLRARQHPGDLIVFDDVQIFEVKRAVNELDGYHVEFVPSAPERMYAIARRV